MTLWLCVILTIILSAFWLNRNHFEGWGCAETCTLHRCPPLPKTTTTAVSISRVTPFPPQHCAADPPLACATLPWQTWQLLITFSSVYSQPDPGCKGPLVGSRGPAAKIRSRLNQQADLVVASVCVSVCCLSAAADQKTDPTGFPVPFRRWFCSILLGKPFSLCSFYLYYFLLLNFKL